MPTNQNKLFFYFFQRTIFKHSNIDVIHSVFHGVVKELFHYWFECKDKLKNSSRKFVS